MKFLVEASVPNEVGNKKLKDGSMMKDMHAYLKEVKPEAVYFSIAHGQRTIYFVVNLQAAEKLPEITEPLWLDFQAHVKFRPVMDAAEFEKAVPGIERIVNARR